MTKQTSNLTDIDLDVVAGGANGGAWAATDMAVAGLKSATKRFPSGMSGNKTGNSGHK